MWGYPRPVLGAVDPFLEPFRGHLSPNIDNVSEKLTLRYPHEGPWVELREQSLLRSHQPSEGEQITLFQDRDLYWRSLELAGTKLLERRGSEIPTW